MANKGVAVLGFALIVLLGALAIPAAINSTDDTTVESQQLDIGETGFYNGQIEVSVLDSTQTEVTVRIADIETGESVDRTIAEGNNTTVSFEPGDITVTNDVSNNQGATLTVEYESIYGFSPAARTVSDSLPIILVTMFFIAIMAAVGVKI